MGGGRQSKVGGKNAKLIIHEHFLLFRLIFGIFLAIGQRETNELSRAEQGASKATSGDLTAVQSTLLIGSLFGCVTNCAKVEGLCPSTFKFGGARAPPCPPVPPPMNGQVEKQDTSGNECKRECESETVDHDVMVVSTYFNLFLRTTLKGWTSRSQKAQAATDMMLRVYRSTNVTSQLAAVRFMN